MDFKLSGIPVPEVLTNAELEDAEAQGGSDLTPEQEQAIKDRFEARIRERQAQRGA